MGTRKKILFILVLIVLLFMTAVGFIAFRFYSDYSSDKDAELFGDVKISPEKIYLGNNVTVDVQIKTPWHRKPVLATLEPAKGSQLLDNPDIKLNKIRYGYFIWDVIATIQPYRTGKLGKGKIQIELNQSEKGYKMKSLTMELPGFEVLPVAVDSSELLLAGKMNPDEYNKRKIYWWYYVIAVVAVASLVIWLLRRRKRSKEEEYQPPVWERVLSAISSLKVKYHNNEFNSEKCVAGLTDIVRGYLEERFSLHAPTQTTPEFLVDLEKSKELLNSSHKGFLKDFMNSADLVKFASLPADNSLVDDAINKAEQLVRETSPVDSEVKK